VAKTRRDVRQQAIEVLTKATWIREHNVTVKDLDAALHDEDDFDACVTAAALLRCQIENLPLHESALQSPRAEGGILGTASVNLALSTRVFAAAIPRRATSAPATSLRQSAGQFTAAQFRCPIPGCDKVFFNTRSGWDRHVELLPMHPAWHPHISSTEARKQQFRTEFPDFFKGSR
jgi:hypothetical protein